MRGAQAMQGSPGWGDVAPVEAAATQADSPPEPPEEQGPKDLL